MQNDSLNKEKESDSGQLAGKSFSIKSDRDLVEIRDFGRRLAAQVGFNGKDQTLIATALSEICRNALEYAGSGEVTIEIDQATNPGGISITVSDNGPGIDNVEQALREGFSTGRGLGVGLPGAKRIMDRFEIESGIGKGTIVKMGKRLNKHDFR